MVKTNQGFLVIYKGGLKSLFDDVISAVNNFFMNGIQTLMEEVGEPQEEKVEKSTPI